MLKIKEIPSVYTGFLKNKQGFTMLSALFTIMIISLSLPLFIYLLQSINKHPTNEEQFSIQHFYYFLQNEMKQSTGFYVLDNQLRLTSETGDLISIQLQGNHVVRKVNRKGYEIYLRDVEQIHVTPIDYGIKISIITSKGEQYEKQIIYYE